MDIRKLTSIRLFAVTAALVAAAACGTEPGDENNEENLDGKAPAYLIHSSVTTDAGRSNYFSLVDSVTEVAHIDYARSLELPGRPRLYPASDYGFVLIGNAEDLTLTKYEVEDGALVAGDSLSLQAYGINALDAQAVLFLSETKAYYKDRSQMQIIVLNPQAMEVEKTIKLPEELIQDEFLNRMSEWATRDGEAYITVSWYAKNYERVEPGAVLISIDPATDTLTQTSENRCRGLVKTASYDGDLYFFSDVFNALGYTVSGDTDGGQKSCILRIKAGSKAFDPDYLGSTDGAFGANHVGTVVTVSKDGEAWAAVADTSITPSEPGTTYSQWYSKGWSWWHLPLGTLDSAVRVEGEPGGYSSKAFGLGSNFFITRAEADFSKSTLVDLSSGTPTDGLSFTGSLLDIAEIL